MPEAGQGTYRANEVIEVAFTFNTGVVVEGDVCVELYVGYDGYHSNSVREANYHRGSGTDTLEFGYTIRPGDMDSRGIMVALGTETTGFCGSGTIKAHGTDVQRIPRTWIWTPSASTGLTPNRRPLRQSPSCPGLPMAMPTPTARPSSSKSPSARK